MHTFSRKWRISVDRWVRRRLWKLLLPKAQKSQSRRPGARRRKAPPPSRRSPERRILLLKPRRSRVHIKRCFMKNRNQTKVDKSNQKSKIVPKLINFDGNCYIESVLLYLHSLNLLFKSCSVTKIDVLYCNKLYLL